LDLSDILKTFNDPFGTLTSDADRIVKHIHDHTAPKLAADQPSQNAKRRPDRTGRRARARGRAAAEGRPRSL
jgi:hypothetical protein